MQLTICLGALWLAATAAAPTAKPAVKPAACPPGQSKTAETQGHCCWPAQVWSSRRATCVGIPTCPAGYQVEGEACKIACPQGQEASEDTKGHCCWRGQAWSVSRNACVGLPECPPEMAMSGESCVAAPTWVPAPAPPPAPACPEGQLQTVDTLGHCCWRGQAWSASRSTCVGVPECPAGMVASGESCLKAPAAPAAPPPAAATAVPAAPPPRAAPPPQAAPPAPAATPPQAATPPAPTAQPAPPAPACSDGKVQSSDTYGHCCWPGQAWSVTRSVCAGVPECPAKLVVDGEGCLPAPLPPATPAPQPAPQPAPPAPACAEGQLQTADTQGHCCWPDQVWSGEKSTCVGVPRCPPGMAADGNLCKAVAAKASPPASTAGQVPPAALPTTTPAPVVKRTVKERQTSKIIAGSILLAVGAASVGGSVPLWQDGLDTDNAPLHKTLTTHDGVAIGEAALLDVVAVVTLTVGSVLLGKGLMGREVVVSEATNPSSGADGVAQAR